MVRVLFTGATGLLGRYFINTKPEGFELFGTYNRNVSENRKNFFQLDVTDRDQILDSFNIVVHAASIGNVDYCETHKEEASKVNVDSIKYILEACKTLGSKLIFTSSNAVYDGKNPPYPEESLRNPLDYYGKTKLEGEDLIIESGIPYVILRLMTMYGWPQDGGRSNPVDWMVNELTNKRKINVVNDIYNNHLYAGQAAETIWQTIKKEKQDEIYNVAGKSCISRFELALKVADIFNLDKNLIVPVDSSFFKNIAPRPKDTCFDTKKMEDDLSVKALAIEEGLERMKDEER
jgi:dTDP-4-dehydrorhamnose reductase